MSSPQCLRTWIKNLEWWSFNSNWLLTNKLDRNLEEKVVLTYELFQNSPYMYMYKIQWPKLKVLIKATIESLNNWKIKVNLYKNLLLVDSETSHVYLRTLCFQITYHVGVTLNYSTIHNNSQPSTVIHYNPPWSTTGENISTTITQHPLTTKIYPPPSTTTHHNPKYPCQKVFYLMKNILVQHLVVHHQFFPTFFIRKPFKESLANAWCKKHDYQTCNC